MRLVSCTMLVVCCLSCLSLWGQLPNRSSETVQDVLEGWYKRRPELMERLYNGRLCLKSARAERTPPALEQALKEAFYQENAPLCREYGRRYLLDWRLLLAKSARETYWGSSRLCNSATNYFGIRVASKEWMCEVFEYCEAVEYTDPDLAYFYVFDDFEDSLWMFIHTIYNRHFLERLPDAGARVTQAIEFERRSGWPYWNAPSDEPFHALQLPGAPYTSAAIIDTWSGYPINNLCVQCDPQSDHDWIAKVQRVEAQLGLAGL